MKGSRRPFTLRLDNCVSIGLASLLFSLVFFVLVFSSNADAAETNETIGEESLEAPSQADIRELARLLSDKRVAAWLQNQATAAASVPESDAPAVKFRDTLRSRLDLIRTRATDIVAATQSVPGVPTAFAKAWTRDVQPGDALRSVVYTLIFIFIGAGLEWLFWRYLAPVRLRLEFTHGASFADDMRFLMFDWSAIVGHLVLGLLIGVVALRFLTACARFLLAPQVDELRLLPLDRTEANRAFFWSVLVVSVGLVCLLTADTFREIGVMGPAEIAVDTAAVIAFACTLLAAIWSWHRMRRKRHESNAYTLTQTTDQPSGSAYRKTDLVAPLAWTALVFSVALLGLLGVRSVMWTVLLVSLLLPLIALTRNMVNDFFDRAAGDLNPHHSFEPALEIAESPTAAESDPPIDASVMTSDAETDSETDDDSDFAETSSSLSIYRPVVVRLVRFVVVIVGVLLLAAIWDKPIWAVSESSGLAGRLVRAAVDITIALLIADLIWVWAKTLIDRKLDTFETPEHGSAPGPEARMATLLPLFRKVLLVTVIIMMALTVLSSLGVNIGPLLAGAGVLGIAIGFGAQTLVRDIVSGVFFLIDDAFRVGEYIEMGDLRGTVESMSLRSLRVRHHRGAVHTIPFGELTSLTNHSRDWAIIKLEFRVPFDTDLKLVKKLVKQVGKELQANEDYGHHLIEPLKSQGVRRMEEFNMVVGVKFMSKPGEQWTIRRDAYQRIRDVFEENGISFAERNVKVEVVGDVPNEETREAIAGAAQNAIETQIDPALVPVDDTP